MLVEPVFTLPAVADDAGVVDWGYAIQDYRLPDECFRFGQDKRHPIELYDKDLVRNVCELVRSGEIQDTRTFAAALAAVAPPSLADIPGPLGRLHRDLSDELENYKLWVPVVIHEPPSRRDWDIATARTATSDVWRALQGAGKEVGILFVPVECNYIPYEDNVLASFRNLTGYKSPPVPGERNDVVHLYHTALFHLLSLKAIRGATLALGFEGKKHVGSSGAQIGSLRTASAPPFDNFPLVQGRHPCHAFCNDQLGASLFLLELSFLICATVDRSDFLLGRACGRTDAWYERIRSQYAPTVNQVAALLNSNQLFDVMKTKAAHYLEDGVRHPWRRLVEERLRGFIPDASLAHVDLGAIWSLIELGGFTDHHYFSSYR